MKKQNNKQGKEDIMKRTIVNAAVKKIVKAMRKEGLEVNHTNFHQIAQELVDIRKAQLAANIAHMDNPDSFGN